MWKLWNATSRPFWAPTITTGWKFWKSCQLKNFVKFISVVKYGSTVGGPGSVHKLPRILIMFCILRRIYRLCMRNSRYSFLSIETQAYHDKYRNKFHFPKTSCPFFCVHFTIPNTDAVSRHFSFSINWFDCISCFIWNNQWRRRVSNF